MITRITNSELDNEKISQILTPIDQTLKEFDFSNIVVKKPWGYEYLMYSDKDVSIWILHLKKDFLTSMHCHLDKKTSLLVISGEVVCSNLHGGHRLKPGDGLLLDKKVFHSSQAISDGGAIIMEVETPTKKTDLLRMIDSYGRSKKGYESKSEMEPLDTLKEFVHFDNNEFGTKKILGNFEFSNNSFKTKQELMNSIKQYSGVGVLMKGNLIDNFSDKKIEMGDLFSLDELQNFEDMQIDEEINLLKIEFIDKKISVSKKAVLFDYDGVIADTMEYNYLAWKEVFAKFGVEIKREEYMSLEGTKLSKIVEIFANKYHLNELNAEEVAREKDLAFKRIYKEMKIYSGVLDLITKLKQKGIKTAIVTAGAMNRVLSTTPKEILEKIDVIITSDDVENGKPSPEPYLQAMKKLNLSSNECIVVENAPLGISSAKNAGMYCIAITSTVEKEKLMEANQIVEKFSTLENLDVIKSLI